MSDKLTRTQHGHKTKITDRYTKSLPAPAKGSKIYYDASLQGFGIRVTKAGAKAFVLNYYWGGREHRITIGQYPAWSAELARKRAMQMRTAIDCGENPLHERREEREAKTVGDLWEYYRIHHLPSKAERSIKDYTSMFQTYILPRLEDWRVKDVTETEIVKLHNYISELGKKVRANRVIEVLQTAFELAIRFKWTDTNPCKAVKPNPEMPRQHYLTPEQVRNLLTALDSHAEQSSANVIRILLFTGARLGETLQARWCEIDFAGGRWRKPSAHTKTKRDHVIPLNAMALTVLQAQKKLAGDSEFIFPSISRSKHLTCIKRTWKAVSEKAELPCTRLHDLRHTYASILISNNQTLGVIGALLGHTQPQTTMRYAHLMDNALREGTNTFCEALYYERRDN